MRRFALDQNFPLPLIVAVRPFAPEAELVSIRDVDPRMAELADWRVVVALHQDPVAWDGLVTTDEKMLSDAKLLAALLQTRLSLVITAGSGHDPLKAAGLLLTHLPSICRRTDPTTAQMWNLTSAERRPEDPWAAMTRLAQRRRVQADRLYAEHRLTDQELRGRR